MKTKLKLKTYLAADHSQLKKEIVNWKTSEEIIQNVTTRDKQMKIQKE